MASPFTDLASFPNSRIKPRAATRIATPGTRSLAFTDGVVSVLPANADRTYATLKNNSTTAGLTYCYGSAANIATDFFRLGAGQAIDLESPEEVFVKPDADLEISIEEGQG